MWTPALQNSLQQPEPRRSDNTPGDSFMVHVYFVVTPGVLLLDYAGPAEAFRMARDMGAALTLHACGPQSRAVSSLGTELYGIEPLPEVVPTGGVVMITGNCHEVQHQDSEDARAVVEWLRQLRASPAAGMRVGSICSGALLLAQSGWLDGRHCTTHHSLITNLQALTRRAVVHADRIFVVDGAVMTSAGVSTGIDLALHLIEQLATPELAAGVARQLVLYQRRGTHEPQTSPWLAHRNHMHPAVHRAQDAVASAPQRSWTLAELAHVACVSPRHLSRLFAQHTGISLVTYQQQLRIAHAKVLLAQQGWPVERVAEACGFGSARDLRRVWRQHEAGSPVNARAGRPAQSSRAEPPRGM